MSIAINSNFERDQLEASFNGEVQFFFSFPILDEDYLSVYQRGATETPNDDDQLLVLGDDYVVTGAGTEAGGYITLLVGATLGDIITLVGTQPIERETVFDDLNPFTVSLNQQLNAQTIMQQQTYTYWANMTPHYNFDELVSQEVRPDKLILPMLPDSHCWVGRGERGDDPDDITTRFIGGIGTGNVLSSGPGMRPSITRWTGTDFVITDSEANIDGAYIVPTDGTTEEVTGFGDDWGAFHWPAHVIGDRPASPNNGDTYYDTTSQQFFGYQNGAWVAFSTGSGTAGGNIITVNQIGHNFVPGNYVYVANPTGAWTKTLATTPETAELQGLVTKKIDDDNFIVQFGGLVDVSTWDTVPAWFTALTPGGVYFLSDQDMGQHSLDEPVIDGEVSLPVFWAITATTGQLRHSRGFIIGGEPEGGGGSTSPDKGVRNITQAISFDLGDVLYLAADDTFAKAISTSLATSQAEWVVTNVITTGMEYTIQQGGWVSGVITQDDNMDPIDSGTVYYLSKDTAGKLTKVFPAVLGNYNKPFYVQQTLATNLGWLLDQKPTLITAPATPGGQQLIGTFDMTDTNFVDLKSVLDGTYTDIKVVGRNLTAQQIPPLGTAFDGITLRFRVATSNAVRTDLFYVNMNGNVRDNQILNTNYGGGQTFVTLDGGAMEFELECLGANNEDVFKFFTLKNRQWVDFYSPPKPAGAGNPNKVETMFAYTGNTDQITGFYIYLDYPDGSPQTIFRSGSISVYGTVA